jgi:hypothetical protein
MFEESKGEIRFRIEDPKEFIQNSFRRKKISNGVALIVGKQTAKGPMKAQALRFSKEFFDKKKAEFWIETVWKKLNPQEKVNKDAKKLGWSSEKYELIKLIIDNAPKEIQDILRACELVGLNERVTYHKPGQKEEVPYTHIFENECVIVKHKQHPMLIIYGPKIEYVDNFIEG